VNEPRSNSYLPDESEADRCHATGKPAMNRHAHDSLLAHMVSQLLSQDLSNRNLSEVPASVLRTSSLQALAMPYNELAELPDALGHLTALRVLDVSNNMLSTIPNAFSTLVNLQEINLSYNRMHNTARETHQVEQTCC
jgi:Leucine-rich repeat (LRR) protein